MKKIWKRFLLWFDRAFSTHKVFNQLLVVVILCVLCTAIFWLFWLLLEPCNAICNADDRHLNEVIRLMFGATNYPLSGSVMPHWYQLLIAFVGTMFFTAFLISTLSNILTPLMRSCGRRRW